MSSVCLVSRVHLYKELCVVLQCDVRLLYVPDAKCLKASEGFGRGPVEWWANFLNTQNADAVVNAPVYQLARHAAPHINTRFPTPQCGTVLASLGSHLKVCPQGFSCCTLEMEEKLSQQSRTDLKAPVHQLSSNLQSTFTQRHRHFDHTVYTFTPPPVPEYPTIICRALTRSGVQTDHTHIHGEAWLPPRWACGCEYQAVKISEDEGTWSSGDGSLMEAEPVCGDVERKLVTALVFPGAWGLISVSGAWSRDAFCLAPCVGPGAEGHRWEGTETPVLCCFRSPWLHSRMRAFRKAPECTGIPLWVTRIELTACLLELMALLCGCLTEGLQIHGHLTLEKLYVVGICRGLLVEGGR
ncbi:hypothetical protein DNTS_024183 [Danionella cerebrum]|uniref:Uncharacterized protein n=1 Tax=Danionella cerebrum TaxID=2873325 RepID=A0A553RIL7_9TELE|nr:hypothetical protein DNTS_024183 [Danionella translucida]